MAYNTLIYEKRDDGIAVITLNRPQAMNSLNPELVGELEDAIDRVTKDDSVKVLILTGAGRAFSAGGDFKALHYLNEDPPAFLAFVRRIQNLLNRIEDLPKPTMAAISGYCIAGGLELANVCDILIADENAQIGDGHINYGVIPGGGATQRLPRKLGAHKAKELIFTGAFLNGHEAERIGLVNKVAPAGKVVDTAVEMAKVIAGKFASVVAADKYLVNEGINTDLKTGLELEIQVIYNSVFSPDRKRGVQSFIERKKE